jgi:mono/diheme cytochrome c family protein
MSTEEATNTPEPAVDGELYGVLAEYDSPGALIKGARAVRDAGYTEFDCYSPFPIHGIDPAMGIKRTILPVIVFCGGLAGTIGGAYLQWWMNAYNWPWNVSGKPFWSIPANVPIAYETTILASVLTTFFGMWILNKLPQVWHPFFKLDRFTRATDDGFFLGIEAADKKFEQAKTTALLEKSGATAVEVCHYEPDPDRRKMPRWIWAFIIATTVMAMIPFALIAKARAQKSSEPHWHIFPDMDFQPRAKSDSAFAEFPDGRANRGEVAGTVARGFLKEDDPEFWWGLSDDGAGTKSWVTGLPARVTPTPALMARGRERFDIYCAPCHGYDGQGKGTVPTRLDQVGSAWAVANLTLPDKVTMPNGQLFNTISNGRNTMRGYASQIPVEDRWAIVLYVRALQRGQHPGAEDRK